MIWFDQIEHIEQFITFTNLLIHKFANFFYLCPIKRNTMLNRTTSWTTPYTFSSKEKDVETGYGYFGARYYDSGLSIWLSVDPMSDKYPNMSPYNYCANNPVILVDPDGNSPTRPEPVIKYTGYGTFEIDLNQLSSSARKSYHAAINDRANWTVDPITGYTDIGISLTAFKVYFKFKEEYNTYGPASTTLKTQGENAQSTQAPDRRVGRTIISAPQSATGRACGVGLLLINAAIVAIDLKNSFNSYSDAMLIYNHRNMLIKATEMVQEHLNSGNIPLVYCNPDMLSKIIYYVYCGKNVTFNRDVESIGNSILYNSLRYDRKTYKVYPLIDGDL